MSTVAAGAYIRTLREERFLSRARLAAAIGTHESQIERIERGEQDTRGSLLIAIVHAIRGSLDQIGQLLLDETATSDDGRLLAQEWLSQEARDEIDRFAAIIPDNEISAVITQIEKLQEDPEAMFRLRGYLERLVEEYVEDQQKGKKRTLQQGPLGRRRFPWHRK